MIVIGYKLPPKFEYRGIDAYLDAVHRRYRLFYFGGRLPDGIPINQLHAFFDNLSELEPESIKYPITCMVHYGPFRVVMELHTRQNKLFFWIVLPLKEWEQNAVKSIKDFLPEADFEQFHFEEYPSEEEILAKNGGFEYPRFVFVIMPVRNDMEHIYAGIEAAADREDIKFRVERVQDIRGDYRITERIIDLIHKARFIVADLTYERPNVYFELGYARGLGKMVTTIAREGTKLHFDVKDLHTPSQ